jgi:2OG-Fe(II) oxygenase superfamily
MSEVHQMRLAGSVPVLRDESIVDDAYRNTDNFRTQLTTWGFMAMEVPGIGARVDLLYDAFSVALASGSPALADYSTEKTPQASSGGNHGFFTFGSEVPRLAEGKPDPKEFVHVSGAMLDDVPPGSAAMLSAFPAFAEESRALFTLGFAIAEACGDVVRELLPGDPPKLELAPHSSILRTIHYRESEGKEVLAHEHSGIQMLGVQFPPSEGGLQYVLNDGTWIEPALAGTDVLLCNIGRMLSEASGRRFRPSTHRVHRSRTAQSEERWSAVLFVHPNHESGQWHVDESGTVVMSDATWGQFVRHGLHELGLSD